MSQVQLKTINALTALGVDLAQLSHDWDSVLEKAFYKNGWFTIENSKYALEHWSKNLSSQNLQALASQTKVPETQKNVGIVMAGNIPLVGFHDFVCVLLSGHKAIIKMSSDDDILLKYLLSCLQNISPGIEDFWEIRERLNNVDAVIATGSNNTARYFEYYFRNIPHIIRKSRTSVAIIHPEITDNDLQLLGEDIFRYYGLGCRNVGKLFLPAGFDPTRILDNLMPYSFVLDHHKYANNYTYHRAIYLLNQTIHLDTGFLLFKEDKSLYSPLGTLFYEFYGSKTTIQRVLGEHLEHIQCVVGDKSMWPDAVPFGHSQIPELNEFADNVNTFELLNKL